MLSMLFNPNVPLLCIANTLRVMAEGNGAVINQTYNGLEVAVSIRDYVILADLKECFLSYGTEDGTTKLTPYTTTNAVIDAFGELLAKII